MIIIAPSLLAADFARLADDLRRAEEGGADWHHVDVMDGHFVPNITIGPAVVAALHGVVTKPLDVHLMIEDPWKYAPEFLDAGAAGVTFHIELEDRGDVRALLHEISGRGARAGLAINPDGDVARLEPYLDVVDMILVMSVFPGFGGQSFIPDVLDGVRALRSRYGFTRDIQMDGGIGPSTIAACAQAGCNVFVAGTAIYGAGDLGGRISQMREAAEKASARA